MNSGELFRALAHAIIDGNYGNFTIHTDGIRLEPVYGIDLFIIPFGGDKIRITSTIGHLEGKKGYHESDVDELKKLVSEATSKIAPAEIYLCREGCDATCYMRLFAPCSSEGEVPSVLSESVKVMEDAVDTVFKISDEHKRKEAADIPF